MSKFEVYVDKADQYRWRLKAANGENVAASGEGYTTKQSCLHGLDVVKREAPGAPIEDLT